MNCALNISCTPFEISFESRDFWCKIILALRYQSVNILWRNFSKKLYLVDFRFTRKRLMDIAKVSLYIVFSLFVARNCLLDNIEPLEDCSKGFASSQLHKGSSLSSYNCKGSSERPKTIYIPRLWRYAFTFL